jgi:hypothetical protein
MPRIKKPYTVTLTAETVALLHFLGERMTEPFEKDLNRSLTIEAVVLFAAQASIMELQAFIRKHKIKGRELYPKSFFFEAILAAVQIRNAGREPFDIKKHKVEEYLQPYSKKKCES